ncbi:MAG: glycosyltransferase family 39 protein [Chloroflexi bacterium]|nr:glycosyltransferase family 39 protein [Chloroflexota bacterium]
MLEPRARTLSMPAAQPTTTHPSLGRSLTALFAWITDHEYVALAGVLLAMLLIRVVALGAFPDTLNPDEADNIEGAVRILHGAPPQNGFFGFDWTGEPAMSAYIFAGAIKLFGLSPFGARLPTALISVLSLAVFYPLLRRQVAVLPALLATLLFGSQLWYLQMSRMAWTNEHVTLFTLGAVYALLTALRAPGTRRGRLWFLGCGLCCALTLYGYPAARMLLPSLYLLLPFAILHDRRRWKDILAGYIAMGLFTAVLFLPEAVYVANHLSSFMLRFSVVSILDKPDFLTAPGPILARQLIANFLGLWVGVYNNVPNHFPVDEPLLDPLTGVLVALGAVLSLAIRRFRVQFETWMWWSILLLGWFVSEVLTIGTPDGTRATSWMPALFVFAGMTLDVAFNWAARLGTSARSLALLGGSLVIVLAAYSDVSHYVQWMSLPSTREMRQPYISDADFPDWAAAIIQRAESGAPGFTVDEWRSGVIPHTLGSTTTDTARTTPMTLTATPRDQWPSVLATFGTDGPSKLSAPRAVAVDQLGNVYVLDGDPNVEAIKKFDRNGNFLLAWGSPGDQNGQFHSASAVAVAGPDRVLVLDADTAWVQVFDEQGTYLGRWGGPESDMYRPRAMQVGQDGNVSIADTGRARIVQASPDGHIQSRFSTLGGGPESEPAGLVPLASGDVLVADAKQGALRTFTTGGTEVAHWPFVSAIALDAPRIAQVEDGSFYVTLPSVCGVEHVSAAGEPLATNGTCEANDYLEYPTAIAADSAGHVYVGDLNEHAVKVLATTP